MKIAVSVSLLGGLWLSASSVADLPPIERLVPREAVLVAGIPNVSATWERIQATPIGAYLRSDQMQALLKELVDEQAIAASMRESGLDGPEAMMPRGGVGAALFLEMDEELGMKRPAYLVAADYGDRAEAFAKALREQIDTMARESGTPVEERDVRGRTVVIFEIPQEPEDEVDDGDDFDDDFGGFDPFGGFDLDPSSLFAGLRTVHFVRDADRLMLCSSLLALEDALGVIDGEALRSNLADNPEFQEMLAQLGGARDLYGALFTAPLQQMLGPVAGMPLSLAQPFVAQLFGDIRAHSIGIEVSEDEAMTTQTVGMLIPRGRAGLLTLVDGAVPRGPLPSFVGADAIGYATMSLRLDRLMPIVDGLVQGLPPMVAEMAVPMLEQFGPALQQAFGGLGPDMHSITFAPTMVGGAPETVMALRCTRIEAVNALVAMFGPGIGLMPRDFLGQTIYSSDEAPMAVGLGGGWMVWGSDQGVERILRSVGQADLPTLSDEPAFRQVSAALPAGDLLGWGFNDTVAATRVRTGTFGEMFQMAQAAAGEMGGVDAERMARIVERALDPDLIERHFGPQMWTFGAIDNGLVFRSMLLRPTSAD